ncbi:MAG: amino acid decarboxylase [Holophagales bacterium]|jgi:aromatic-L-amino-acid decarboxylase|nr:amino acid decarboxylase [Holophagales bacterium]MBK9965813.1 amino acid decarboxylase [Holophagales bacterium]
MNGDFSPDTLRAWGGAAVERLARYLETIESRPVLARTKPGELLAQFPPEAPEEPEPWEAIERDLDRLVEPNLTHWQHPGFMAYFATNGSVPGIVGETLAAGYNQVGILWRSSPASNEMEQAMVRWLANFVGLPSEFDGQLADTASSASLIALAAAREQAFPDVRKTGLAGHPPAVVYCSELAHSSIDKACVVLGLGIAGLRKIPTDAVHRMDLAALEAAIAEDRAAGRRPIAVVGTAGTTAVTSVDPLPGIAAICRREGLWMHVDAAYAGAAASLPEKRPLFAGWEEADSIVWNPHKWLFLPLECTGLFFRKMDRVRRAFSVVPTYLETPEGSAGVREYMDYGIQLGRRFRALKAWIMMRTFGAKALRERLRSHIDLALRLEGDLRCEPDVEILAPVPFSVVVFRFAPASLSGPESDALNQRILEEVNREGRFFISHGVVKGRYALHAAIGSLRTEDRHVAALLESLRSARAAAETVTAPNP